MEMNSLNLFLAGNGCFFPSFLKGRLARHSILFGRFFFFFFSVLWGKKFPQRHLCLYMAAKLWVCGGMWMWDVLFYHVTHLYDFYIQKKSILLMVRTSNRLIYWNSHILFVFFINCHSYFLYEKYGIMLWSDVKVIKT